MSESNPIPPSTTTTTTTTNTRPLLFLILILAPVAVAVILYGIDEFDPATLPEEGLKWESVAVPNLYNRVLSVTERICDGLLPGPEDLVYDEEEGVIYASCNDGWVRRVAVTELAKDGIVEDWVHVGGRPLGLALGSNKELIVAESEKGLLKVSKEREVKLLTDEAAGLKFRLTDGVDVAKNGVIYFTDASYKYNLKLHRLDILEGRPHGRLMSYDPSTNQTKVLVKDLYFANGVALSPQQDFVVFCETLIRRCQRYYIEGEKKGERDNFVESLPGYPDNIHYDGEGHYWIALATGKTFFWDSLMRYPSLRKTAAILARFVEIPHMQRDAGVVSVNLDGDVAALYSDPGLAMITSGIKIGNHLYHGSLVESYISRVNLSQFASPAA